MITKDIKDERNDTVDELSTILYKLTFKSQNKSTKKIKKYVEKAVAKIMNLDFVDTTNEIKDSEKEDCRCPYCGKSLESREFYCHKCEKPICEEDVVTLREYLLKSVSSCPFGGKGQMLFSYAWFLYPKEVGQIAKTKDDCYFSDDKIEDFINKLYSLVYAT